ncbi:MAG: hypothetical protein WAV41_03225 [Microgenomates group bacterium]
MPNWLDRLMEDATTPLEGGNNGQPKQDGIVVRNIKSAIDGLRNDIELPIVYHVGEGKDGNPALYDTSGDGRPGIIRRALSDLVTDISLPVGYALSTNEKGEQVVVMTGGNSGESISSVVKATILANIAPDMVEDMSRAGVGFFRDMNSPLEALGVTVEEVERRQARNEKIKETAAVVGSYVAGKTVEIGRGVSNQVGKGLKYVWKKGGDVYANMKEKRQSKARNGATVIELNDKN